MAYTRYNVVRAGDEYKDKDGKEKVTWEKVGVMIRNDDSGALSLKLFITGAWYSIFEHNDRDDEHTAPSSTPEPEPRKKW